MIEYSGAEWLVLVQQELLLFAGAFFLIGALDEITVDFAWIWLKLTGRARTETLAPEHESELELSGPAAVFIPTWQEAAVIGTTIRHALAVWPHSQLRMYVGCYDNDPATLAAAAVAGGTDSRLRIVVQPKPGPTTKADCLNSLYAALQTDEARTGKQASMVLLHDAEDMVDPAALTLIDRSMQTADIVQLPVLPEPQPTSPWIAGHYCEEFAEAHGKAMVVRDALGAGMPLAGVGCAISRAMLTRLAAQNGGQRPFADGSLTEDYELGLGVAELGGSGRFVRMRHEDGRLIATRACFPAKLDQAVRQKTRWVHGIAFQGWDHLGWSGKPSEFWMRLRDRRGPFTALVLAAAYLLLVLSAIVWALNAFWQGPSMELNALLRAVLALNFISFAWRAVWRFAFTAREYGLGEGLLAILRIPVANIIAIMAGRRALMAYVATLSGEAPRWDKTDHSAHPATHSAVLAAGRGSR
ncbi:glycosyl transferase family protein [Pontixanthobacter luteolus]|uniref:glycosyl transferase family protein n=1 Tax=Pontixanthobacter luteolus TaxID=295089 RepID=UPI002303D892|nr:glycosyl transferase family protein [Pontixanthobacter luteolus]